MCAVICRKATFTIPDAISEFPDANYPSSRCQSLSFRAQNRGFCALLAFGTLVFGLFEHKIEVFVRFYPPKPSFSGFLSTKSRFLCFFTLRNPRFRAFRAQNLGFCAFLALGPLFSGISSTKSKFLCFFGLRDPRFQAFRAQNRGFCALLAFETLVFGLFEHKIEVFVRFCPPEPSFSGFLSTKSGFLCS